jgi:hypothetical protein
VTEGFSAEPDPGEEPEVEWHPVASWPVRSRQIVDDIEAILRVVALMTGAADDAACQVFIDFLNVALLHRRRELSLMVLAYHHVDAPEQGDIQTPQQRMSAGLAHIADEVRKRRPDLVPERQPFTERRTREPQ